MASFKGFGKRLASTDAQIRSEAMQEMKAKLATEELSLVDCMKVWKALFYCIPHLGMWMCDGKENQTSLSDDLGSLVPAVPDPWSWVTAFFEVMRLEWDTLDRYRFDKYMYLVRVHLRKTMELAAGSPELWTTLVRTVLEKSLDKGMALGFHILDVFAEERPVKKRKATIPLLRPFVEFLKEVKLPHVAEAVCDKVLGKFLGKEKYAQKLKAMIVEVLAGVQDTSTESRSCGVAALHNCLKEPETSQPPQAKPAEELPSELLNVMERFYPEPKPKKRRAKPDFIPEPKKPENYEDISVPLPTPMKKKPKNEPQTGETQIGSGVKKRKVMFNLKLNTTQRNSHTDFGKNEVVSNDPPQPAPVAPKGVLRVRAHMKSLSSKSKAKR